MDEDLRQLASDIAKSHAEPSQSQLQTQVFMRCMYVVLLPEISENKHLFCDELLMPILAHTLIMFSFPDSHSPQRLAVEDRMAASLDGCRNCVRSFHRCLSQMRLRFVVMLRIPVAQVEKFLGIVDNWLAARLQPRLQAAPLPLDMADLSQADLLHELLCSLGLLRRPDLRLLLESKLPAPQLVAPHISSLLPGLVFFAVEGSSVEMTFANSVLDRFTSDRVLDTPVSDEVATQSYRLQNSRYFTAHFSLRFWLVLLRIHKQYPASEFAKLLSPPDLDAMSAHTNVRLFPLLRVLVNNIMAQLDTPLPPLLALWGALLADHKTAFWKLVPGTHPQATLDTVLGNTHFHSRLHAAAQASSTDPGPSLDTLLAWVDPFLASLVSTQRQTAAIRLAEFLAQREQSEPNNTRYDLPAVLASCFAESAPTLANASLLIFKLRDSRAAAAKHVTYYLSLLRKEVPAALALVSHCIRYDLLVAAHNSSVIHQKQIPTFLDVNTSTFWTELAKIPLSRVAVAQALLEAMADCTSIVIFKSTKSQDSKEYEAALAIHNRNAETVCSHVSVIVEKLSVMDSKDLQTTLCSESALLGIWSCITNPAVSQAATTVIYQLNDSEGRFEAISSLLAASLKGNLSALNKTLLVIAEMKMFEPCPKTLRILMDIIKALTDPLEGLLCAQSAQNDESKLEINQFWEASWLLLVTIYQQTLTWALLYHLTDLIEFTRDTLDTSHSLIDAFRVFLSYNSTTEEKNALYDTFMQTFIHVIVWLRLGDPSLLNSCVSLVFKGFDLAKELDYPVDKNFIITFAKYGAKAKRFNNKLTEQQRNEILAKASEFDSTLVSYVIDEDARDRAKSKSVTPTEPAKGAAYAYQSRVKQPTQLTLAKFGVVTKQAPVAPPPPVTKFKSNNLEAIRNELKSTRVPSKPLAAPAAARPAGFNHKERAVGRSLNALKPRKPDVDSSEDDGDDDVDVSDLFVDTKKEAKIIQLDIHGKPMTKIAASKRADPKRLEEERMRLRLNINLKPLYSTILKWNYNSNSDYASEERDIYRPIKDKYSSAQEYVDLTESLLMLECWQGIQSSRTTGQELAFELLVGSRTTCDGFFDVFCSMKKSDLSSRKVGDSDLLVLGHMSNKNEISPHEIVRYLKLADLHTCLGKIREIKHANADFCDVTVRVYPQGHMMGLLTPKTVIVAMKVMQMITAEREYSSLKGLQYYDLCDEILAGRATKPFEVSDSEAQKMCKSLNVNVSQAKAIIGTSKLSGFSLIQGPPGTGKTKTILGIVSQFLRSTTSSNVIHVPESMNGEPKEVKTTKRVLICAPSNAAIDELVVRLKSGVMNDSGVTTMPKVVRLGRSDAINPAVRDLGLEEQVERQLQGKTVNFANDPNIRLEHNKCIAERDQLRQALRSGSLSDKETLELETKLREINKKRSELGKRLDEQRENNSIASRTRDIERRQAQAKILIEAQVICSTLSGSAHDFLAGMSMQFDQVIIDEACQSVELSAIIPLRYGCKKCVMVGDPNQLPPTVLSQKAASYRYEESLFVRMQRNNPDAVYLLDVQYRMHPEISKFPSAQFYHSKLSDGPGMDTLNHRPWHNNFPLTPYRFFDITSRHQQNVKSKSFFNSAEARVALELVQLLMQILPSNQFKGRIGIISPYKEQIRTLRDVFLREFGSTIFNEIDFNTVDGFQGQEKEIIIMSCVRASENGSVGFLSDIRRMNVALTRARTTLWILGNQSSLRRDKIWNKLISDAESRSAITPAQPGFLRGFSGLRNLKIAPDQNAQTSTNTEPDVPTASKPAGEVGKEDVKHLSDTVQETSKPRDYDKEIHTHSSDAIATKSDAMLNNRKRPHYDTHRPGKEPRKKPFIYNLSAEPLHPDRPSEPEPVNKASLPPRPTPRGPSNGPDRPRPRPGGGSSIFITKRRPPPKR